MNNFGNPYFCLLLAVKANRRSSISARLVLDEAVKSNYMSDGFTITKSGLNVGLEVEMKFVQFLLMLNPPWTESRDEICAVPVNAKSARQLLRASILRLGYL